LAEKLPLDIEISAKQHKGSFLWDTLYIADRSTYCVHLTSRCLELSSADTERALISNYNKLVCSSGVTLFGEWWICASRWFYRMETLMGVFQAIETNFFLYHFSLHSMQWSVCYRAANGRSSL